MTQVAQVLCVPGRSGFFTDDQAAIRAGSRSDGGAYLGEPVTPGFSWIRQPGEAVSVLLVLDDGHVAHGDCAAVQYAGAGGRDPFLTSTEAIRILHETVVPWLVGLRITDFREAAVGLEGLHCADGSRLHTAIRYGVSQALLDAAAHHRRVTMAEVIRDEWATGVDLLPVPMFAQSGDDRRSAVDRMVLKGADVLPHGLINSAATKLGHEGELLVEYLGWVRDRVIALRPVADYRPVLHVDVYGTIGEVFGPSPEGVARYLEQLGDVAAPFNLRIEHPVDAGSTPAQVEALSAIRSMLNAHGSSVQLVADEWCNNLADVKLFVAARAVDMVHVKMPDLGSIADTVTALLHVRSGGLLAYCGGTCNETDRSAQVSAHVAMACGAAQVLAKPGMGVDEGLMTVGNEMARTAALAASRAT